MIVIAVVFAGLVIVGGMHLLQETSPDGQKKKPAGKAAAAPKRDAKTDFIAILQKKVAVTEEKLRNLEGEFQAQRLELSRAKEREKELEEEKSSTAFDAQQYKKFQKEHALLKEELNKKERLLEEEISRRRLETTQLANVQTELDALKKHLTQTQDAFRKTQALYEHSVADLREARSELEKQKKAAQEVSGHKTQGGWVAREEFDKVEHELEEKEKFIKKLLALQQQPPSQGEGQA